MTWRHLSINMNLQNLKIYRIWKRLFEKSVHVLDEYAAAVTFSTHKNALQSHL